MKHFLNFLGGCSLDTTFQMAYVHVSPPLPRYYGVLSASDGLDMHFLVHPVHDLGWSVEIISFLVRTEKTSGGTKDQMNKRLSI
jgi:hypothetical protein